MLKFIYIFSILLFISIPAAADNAEDFFKDLEAFEKPPASQLSSPKKTPSPSSSKNSPEKPPGIKNESSREWQEENGREWILKRERLQKSETPATPKLAWKNQPQKKKCEALVKKLRRSFHETRYYSIQGDSCATAVHAQKSLEITEECREHCPESFLESEGFQPRIIRNWDVLKRLGEERCKR